MTDTLPELNARLAAKGLHSDAVSAVSRVAEWLSAGGYRLQRANEPLWHRLRDAWSLRTEEALLRQVDEPAMHAFCNGDAPQVFLIGHDWAKAFENAEDFSSGDYRLPFDKVCFELLINQKRVCVLASQEGFTKPSVLYWVHTDKRWIGVNPTGDSHDGSLGRLIENNLRAVCIALDAEVAYTEMVRAPHKLNKARAAKGKSEIPDYRVVKLTERARAQPRDEATVTGAKKRLHFRRGHWRHFESFKTWIRWTLVGDPDLGFVDKHYRF